MFTATAAATTLIAATPATSHAFEPGFYLMILLVLGGVVGTITTAVQNRHRRHRGLPRGVRLR
ncbi:hypothetical protein [Demequina soli]|uniref:hypothetical protein n=1 Tax=Demequina soli TaxID=1638987 RepID=UPI000780FFB8|nr:hypothetical protein [Demequina soli]